jgi:hypothetical protein
MCALPTATVASTTGPTRFQSVDPAHTALLVMDMQEGLTAQAGPAGDALAARIATAERASRRAGSWSASPRRNSPLATPRCHEAIANGSASVVVRRWRVARRSAPRMPRCIRR